MRKIALGLILATSLFACAQAKPAPKTDGAATSGVNEAVVNEFMRQTFGYDQNLKWQVTDIKPSEDASLTEVSVLMNTPQGQQLLRFYVTPDQKHAISGDFLPFGSDPYAAARAQLQSGVNGPAKGPANASVTIVEFGDLQCPACKRAQPNIEKLLTEVPNVRLVFQQYPLMQLHKWALIAAKYGLCVAKQNNDAYWKFVDTVYQHQDEMQQLLEEQAGPKLKEYATATGVNADQAQQCTDDPEIGAKIQTSIALGSGLGITGTPTFFINGRKVGALPYETLKSITEFQAQNKK